MTLKEYILQDTLGLLPSAIKRKMAHDPSTDPRILTLLSTGVGCYYVMCNPSTPKPVKDALIRGNLIAPSSVAWYEARKQLFNMVKNVLQSY